MSDYSRAITLNEELYFLTPAEKQGAMSRVYEVPNKIGLVGKTHKSLKEFITEYATLLQLRGVYSPKLIASHVELDQRCAEILYSQTHPKQLNNAKLTLIITKVGKDLGELIAPPKTIYSQPRHRFYEEHAKGIFQIAAQALAAIGYFDEKGIVHRDFKPDNLTIDDQGKLYAIDFGLAKINGLEESLNGEERKPRGTPCFIPPEQIVGNKVGSFTDIYALGVTLFKLLTGVHPFHGGDPVSTIKNHLTGTRLRFKDVMPEVPFPDYAAAIEQMMDRKVSNRPSLDELEGIFKDYSGPSITIPNYGPDITNEDEPTAIYDSPNSTPTDIGEQQTAIEE